MADFSNLAALSVSVDTLAEYVFDEIPGEPSIMLAPMTDDNKPFMNERIRVAVERAEKAEATPTPRGKRVRLTADQLDEDREVDRQLIAKCCAKAWGVAPRDATGGQPQFSESNCYDFLKALPNYLFDPLRGFVQNPRNFVDRTKLALPVAGDVVLKTGNE